MKEEKFTIKLPLHFKYYKHALWSNYLFWKIYAHTHDLTIVYINKECIFVFMTVGDKLSIFKCVWKGEYSGLTNLNFKLSLDFCHTAQMTRRMLNLQCTSLVRTVIWTTLTIYELFLNRLGSTTICEVKVPKHNLHKIFAFLGCISAGLELFNNIHRNKFISIHI